MPYAPDVDASIKRHDMVFFRGRYCLYHGAAPVVLLFTPWRLVKRLESSFYGPQDVQRGGSRDYQRRPKSLTRGCPMTRSTTGI